MTPLKEAIAILGMTPLPDDAYDQLIALESQAQGADKQRFEWVWEGFYAAGGKDPETTL